MRRQLRALLFCAAAIVVAACSGDTLTGPLGPVESPSFSQGELLAQSWTATGCREGDTLVPVAPGHPDDRNGDLAVCSSGTNYYDNRLAGGNGGGGGGWTATGCREGDVLVGVLPGHPDDRNEDLAVCRSDTHEYDNRLAGGNGGGGGGWTATGCREGDVLVGVLPGNPDDRNGDLAVCRSDTHDYDNRL